MNPSLFYIDYKMDTLRLLNLFSQKIFLIRKENIEGVKPSFSFFSQISFNLY